MPDIWLWQPVSAPVVGLLWLGSLQLRRRPSQCRRCGSHRRRRLVTWSYDVAPDTVFSRRLFGQDVWPGTWLGWPVAALVSPGGLPIPRKRRQSHRRRRLMGTSWWWGVGVCIGSIVGRVLREASGDGGGAGGGVRGRLNSYLQ